MFSKRTPLADTPKQWPLLRTWLAQATGGLCPDAVKRITHEITEHYAAAVEAHRAEGSTPHDAALLAFEGLGSARRARRQLRRSHFTRGEAHHLALLANTEVLGVKPYMVREMQWVFTSLWAFLLLIMLATASERGDSASLQVEVPLTLWLTLGGMHAPMAFTRLRMPKRVNGEWRACVRRLLWVQALIYSINSVFVASCLLQFWQFGPWLYPRPFPPHFGAIVLLGMLFLMPALIIRTIKVLEKLPPDGVPLTG